ncbi:MAG: hypothetical protein V2J24_02040 [Pseudomonadales bacterium]|nr:hypothetical protein [Pseudomonadales bacterium]
MTILLRALLVLLATGGCAARPDGAAAPALRTEPTAAGLAELEAAAARLVGATRVDLAADVFTVDAEVAVERRRPRSLSGGEDGLDRSAPARLRLERLGATCRLLHAGTGEVVALTAVACGPVPD